MTTKTKTKRYRKVEHIGSYINLGDNNKRLVRLPREYSTGQTLRVDVMRHDNTFARETVFIFYSGDGYAIGAIVGTRRAKKQLNLL